MAYTPTTTYGQELFDRLEPWQTDDLAILCDAIGTMHEEVHVLVKGRGQPGDADYLPGGYGVLFDVDLCPEKWLPYLGQIVGVPIPAGTSETDARALIRGEAAINRGRPASLIAAVQQTLSGGKHVTLTERYLDDPYQVLVVVYAAELIANYATNPSSELTKASGDTADYTVTREASGTGGVPAFAGGWRDKHAFDGSASDSNTGFFSHTFPAAGTYVVSRYVWLPAAWTGGALRITSDSNYTGATETVLKAADLSLRDQYQRISTRITVAAGDLVGAFGVRTASPPSSSGTGVFYTDARQIESGAAISDYVDGNTPGYLFTGAADASSTQRDPAVVLAAAVSQKPAGIVMTLRTDLGWSIGQLVTAYVGQTIGDLVGDFANIGNLVKELPTP